MLLKKIILLLFLLASLGTSLRGSNDWVKLGVESILRQDIESAIFYYTKAIEEDPKQVEVYLKRAEAHLLNGDLEKSTQDKRRAYLLDPALFERLYDDKIQLKFYRDTSN